MKRFLTLVSVLVSIALAPAGQARAMNITGAGSTFAYPILAKWAEAYRANSGVSLNYQSIGSGGGIKQIQAKTVDFGASDKPLPVAELEKHGLIQFPVIMGGVVPVVNLPGVAAGKLRLDGPTLADIFLGKIKRWNDPALLALNPGLALPAQAITVVHRSDGSGTTFIFTNYLSKVSPEWKQKVGEEASVAWPTGVGGKGNEGVASYVRQIKGSIGYVEYAYAKQNNMSYALLKNREGAFVAPNADSFRAAAANAEWEKAPGFYEILTNEPGRQSWPITGATFVLMHKVQSKPEVGRAVLAFFDWAYREGDRLALDLDYIPLPDKVVQLVEETWKKEIRDGARNPLW
jgi:phosphate transport system substrate-binding protein